mmetsp:Transcript_48503/g.110141  ORF Transcript_48503/g.110141 Transcript_48503/m.110141 type:complete len:248 (-) Transcript_48503:98-841(-)
MTSDRRHCARHRSALRPVHTHDGLDRLVPILQRAPFQGRVGLGAAHHTRDVHIHPPCLLLPPLQRNQHRLRRHPHRLGHPLPQLRHVEPQVRPVTQVHPFDSQLRAQLLYHRGQTGGRGASRVADPRAWVAEVTDGDADGSVPGEAGDGAVAARGGEGAVGDGQGVGDGRRFPSAMGRLAIDLLPASAQAQCRSQRLVSGVAVHPARLPRQCSPALQRRPQVLCGGERSARRLLAGLGYIPLAQGAA